MERRKAKGERNELASRGSEFEMRQEQPSEQPAGRLASEPTSRRLGNWEAVRVNIRVVGACRLCAKASRPQLQAPLI